MSPEAQYQKELWGYETLENEKGFIRFQVHEKHVFLADIWVAPDFRREGEASRLTRQVEDLALEQGKQHLVSRVDVTQGGASASLAGHLAYGFVPYGAESGKIWLKKGVTNE